MTRAARAKVTAAHHTLAARLAAVRAQTLALARPLTAQDCQAQSMPDASPVKWHLAHTTWFFETFVLERHEPNFKPHHPAFRVLCNSYDHGVGEQHPRPQRGLVTRPALAEILAWRAAVDERPAALLAREQPTARLNPIELGLHHEQQHQELILTDCKHLLACNPLAPVYLPGWPLAAVAPTALSTQAFEGGTVEIEHDGDGLAFDNEAPRHAPWLQPFALARRPVTHGEWLDFVADGNCLESGALHPMPPRRAYDGPMQLFGDVWEWTASAYLPYPGFRTWDGAVAKYNGKFMIDPMVLRGGSCATPRSHIRASYRNFFPSPTRWQFSGVRLAHDLG
jgi:formylglycine-generating enzyme required for sulfatase activity